VNLPTIAIKLHTAVVVAYRCVEVAYQFFVKLLTIVVKVSVHLTSAAAIVVPYLVALGS
jgi:hypothetical protein